MSFLDRVRDRTRQMVNRAKPSSPAAEAPRQLPRRSPDAPLEAPRPTRISWARPAPIPAPGPGESLDLPDIPAAPPVRPESEQMRFNRAVPLGVRVAAGWSWRLLAVAALVLALGYALRYLSEVFVPLAVAILLTALLIPVAHLLRRVRLPALPSALIALLGGVIVVAGALTLIGTQIASEADELSRQAIAGTRTLIDWLSQGPLKIGTDQLNAWLAQAQKWLGESTSTLAGYAADIGSGVGHFLAGVAITLFSTFFFLFEGRRVWFFVLKFFPRIARRRVDEAARLGWNSLVAFVRATVVVAFVDALGVLIVALIIQVPLAPALAALVFFGAFIPIVGALVSGFVAVVVALVTLGWVKALIMLAGIIVVNQIEGHVLQPFLMGRAVAIHPLAIILGIALGIVVGGIVGALIAVPTMAFAKTFISHLTNSGQDIDLRRNIVI